MDIEKILAEPRYISEIIDHTNLRPDATAADIEKLCQEAVQYKFYAVCVNPCWVELCSKFLKSATVRICSVAGFPFGATAPAVKAYEAGLACDRGASEIDMVINIGALKSKEYALVEEDIKEVVKAVNGATVKVILETCYLTEEEKIKVCQIAVEAGAHFVKTSTGFAPKGATIEDIRLMRKCVGNNFGVKAAGGIRELQTALEMIKAGANRIGSSQSVRIVSCVV